MAGPMKGRERDAPMIGDQTLRFNLHQTFATPDGLILLGFGPVAKLTLFATCIFTHFDAKRATLQSPQPRLYVHMVLDWRNPQADGRYCGFRFAAGICD